MRIYRMRESLIFNNYEEHKDVYFVVIIAPPLHISLHY